MRGLLRLAPLSRALGLALAALAAAAAAPAGDPVGVPHVAVHGTALTEAKPDLLQWWIRVSNLGPEATPVADDHAALVAGVLAFLDEAKVAPEDREMAQLRLGENWEYRDRSRVREGYAATTRIGFRSRDVAGYRDLWLGLARLPGVEIEGAQPDVEPERRIQLRNEARLRALEEARAKAVALAGAVGSSVAEPLVIEEIVEQDFGTVNRAISNNDLLAPGASPEAGGDDGGSLGAVAVVARVRAVFRITTP